SQPTNRGGEHARHAWGRAGRKQATGVGPETSKPADHAVSGLRPSTGRDASSGDVELLLQLAHARVEVCGQLGLALFVQGSSRFAGSGLSGLLRGLELAHDLIDRPASHLALEVLHLAVE